MPRQFDAIVIGSGLGGLTAGALYARAGHRVLVIERNQNFGGAATVYRHGALAIEASLHEIDGLDPEDPKAPILQSLGLDRDVRSSTSAICTKFEARFLASRLFCRTGLMLR
jgi:all-trans-retinol 13,14-reductase